MFGMFASGASKKHNSQYEYEHGDIPEPHCHFS